MLCKMDQKYTQQYSVLALQSNLDFLFSGEYVSFQFLCLNFNANFCLIFFLQKQLSSTYTFIIFSLILQNIITGIGQLVERYRVCL